MLNIIAILLCVAYCTGMRPLYHLLFSPFQCSPLNLPQMFRTSGIKGVWWALLLWRRTESQISEFSRCLKAGRTIAHNDLSARGLARKYSSVVKCICHFGGVKLKTNCQMNRTVCCFELHFPLVGSTGGGHKRRLKIRYFHFHKPHTFANICLWNSYLWATIVYAANWPSLLMFDIGNCKINATICGSHYQADKGVLNILYQHLFGPLCY